MARRRLEIIESQLCRRTPILVVGGAAFDIVSRPGHSNGQVTGQSKTPGKVELSFGGVGRNICEVLARLGESVTFVSAIGDDAVGRALVSELHEAAKQGKGRLDTHFVVRDRSMPTCTFNALLTEDGDTHAAVSDFRIMDQLPEWSTSIETRAKAASLIVTDMNCTRQLLQHVADVASAGKTFWVANTVSVAKAARCIPFLENINILIVNFLELQQISNTLTGSSATSVDHGLDTVCALSGPIFSQGLRLLVVTQGKHGADIVVKATGTPDEFRRSLNSYVARGHPRGLRTPRGAVAQHVAKVTFHSSNGLTVGRLPVTNVVEKGGNSTGAGDTLCGAFCSALLRGVDVLSALSFGMFAGALSAQVTETVPRDVAVLLGLLH